MHRVEMVVSKLLIDPK